MPETLVEIIATLNGPAFKDVVDDEIRRKLRPALADMLGSALPPQGKLVRVPNQPPVEPRVLAIYEALQSPELVERWFIELTTAKRRIERQLAARQSELIAREADPDFPKLRRDHHKWRAGTLRFLNAVEDRIDVARVITGRYHMTARYEAIEADRQALSKRVDELEDAIERHQELTATPDEVDLALYESLYEADVS